jgi:GrpB-like predicted nucleotidyltransferase (UPF0157 family)
VPDTIEIVASRDHWATEFTGLASIVQLALEAVPHRVHHIGSTSVPGLAAKDIIDLMISVPVLDAGLIRPRFETLGWTWRDDIDRDHRPPGADVTPEDLAKLYVQAHSPRRVNCHIRVPGAFNHRYALLFRDYLRALPGPRETYGEIKRRLAARFPDDVDAYYDIKDPVTDVIMAGAECWATATGWQEPVFTRPSG